MKFFKMVYFNMKPRLNQGVTVPWGYTIVESADRLAAETAELSSGVSKSRK